MLLSSAMLLSSNGTALFDRTRAKYPVSGEYGKCLLPLWSDERNTVRRVLEAEENKGLLRGKYSQRP